MTPLRVARVLLLVIVTITFGISMAYYHERSGALSAVRIILSVSVATFLILSAGRGAKSK